MIFIMISVVPAKFRSKISRKWISIVLVKKSHPVETGRLNDCLPYENCRKLSLCTIYTNVVREVGIQKCV